MKIDAEKLSNVIHRLGEQSPLSNMPFEAATIGMCGDLYIQICLSKVAGNPIHDEYMCIFDKVDEMKIEITTIAGISINPTQMTAIMQSNHITMSHEYIIGNYVCSNGVMVRSALLFSFVIEHDSKLIEKLKMNHNIYDLEIITKGG